MKIVISPAKSLDFESELPTNKYTEPSFIPQAEKLNKVLKKLKPKDLSDLMKISDNLAQLNWQRNQDFSVPFTTENARQAVYAFNGDVYQGLDAYSIPENKLDKLQDSLRILSGLYGALKPLDLMQPYRLEMGTQLKVGKNKNLHEFWKKDLTAYLNEELKDDELFVNLASNEYFGSVDAKSLNVPVITPVFKDWKNDNLKVISFYAKKARGSMVRYIIDNDINTLNDLKQFDLDGYMFSQEHTLKENQPTFIR
ncbi:peroxide stress protein YaaA [Cellulophaga baltica]|uniref:peroxide stress protein YaaA n=1 Tax=Cellulophaga TaxID=104264 RepID=UPI001C0659C5|nr:MULTISPECIES: peroxide stress protein YaaA [Cellulophaga]MBU2994965.1 peroxide stress protein YaaA [Cellulophaga baltica]MDO6766360.1 peroxide stress protein YaaA [Cellulophaga sp. 1_MG-2023]